ncbi:MAG: GDP-mannose 4,6-dehydratase, partial [Deltaproteobacteria bacterium]|nr:GDP-mannose 4,6-dehydratase [Deltaproteobacteria bacterium]
IQISTDEVYGTLKDGCFSETSPLQPNSPYAASKAGADHLCRAYAITYRTPVIVTHSCNFYGPNQYPEKLLPLFITNVLVGKKIPVYGDGLQVREWIFTEDHCRAVDAIATSGKIGDVYNIGTAERVTNIDMTKRILALLGKDESMIEHVADRPGHDVRYAGVGQLLNHAGGER